MQGYVAGRHSQATAPHEAGASAISDLPVRQQQTAQGTALLCERLSSMYGCQAHDMLSALLIGVQACAVLFSRKSSGAPEVELPQ